MPTIRAILKFAYFAVFSALTLPFQSLLLVFHKGKYARIIPRIWLGALCFVFRIRPHVEGSPHQDHQTLYISNHLSFFDIAIIGKYVVASFVARGDAKHWPILGTLADLNQTAYVARSRAAAKQDSNAVGAVIESGRNLVIFAEGTSTDGQGVLPFKSSLFSLALEAKNPDLHIQPLSIEVLAVDGKPPQTQEERDVYAWHRDLDTGFFTHWWRFAKHKHADIRFVFYPPIRAKDFSDRKTLAKTCYDTVSDGVRNSPHA